MSSSLTPLPNDYTVPLVRNLEVVGYQPTSGASKVVLRWTVPEDTRYVDHYEVWVSRTAYQNENPYMVASVSNPPAAFTVTADQDTVAVLYVRTVMKDGRASAIYECPAAAVNVYRFVAGPEDISPGSIQNQHFDRVSAYRIKIVDADIVSLTANKITAGTLHIGGVNIAGPGQAFVYDNNDNVIAFIGQYGSYRGIWGKAVWIGGSGPADAPFYVDSSGSVFLSNAADTSKRVSFRLQRNNTETIIDNFTEGSDVIGLRVRRLSDNLRSDVIPGAFSTYQAGGYPSSRMSPSSVVVYSSLNDYCGISSTGLSLVSSGSVVAAVQTSYIQAPSYRVGGSTVIDSSRAGDFTTLRINGTTVVNSSRVVDCSALYVSGSLVVDGYWNIFGSSLSLSGYAYVLNYVRTDQSFNVYGDDVILRTLGATSGYGAFRPRYFSSSSRPTLQDRELALWWDGSAFYLLARVGSNHFRVQMTLA